MSPSRRQLLEGKLIRGERAAERRLGESLEETAARREIERGRAAERRSSESLEETAARREFDMGRAVIVELKLNGRGVLWQA